MNIAQYPITQYQYCSNPITYYYLYSVNFKLLNLLILSKCIDLTCCRIVCIFGIIAGVLICSNYWLQCCRNSTMYKSFEERVGGAYSSVKVVQVVFSLFTSWEILFLSSSDSKDLLPFKVVTVAYFKLVWYCCFYSYCLKQNWGFSIVINKQSKFSQRCIFYNILYCELLSVIKCICV